MPSTNPAETEHEEITSPSTTPAETNQTETDVPEKSESVSLPYVEPIAPGTTGSIEALIPDTTDPVSNPVETTPAASEPAETESNHIHEYAISQQTPTCTANGGTYYYCECGDFYIENEIEAYGHLYMSDVIDPTETEYGYTEYRCMYCMHGYRDNYTNPTGTSVPEDGHVHSYVEFMVQEPTCTEYGRIEYTCECGAVSGSEQVEPYGHDYDCIPVVVVPPTETEQGYTEHECIICGDIYRDSYTDYTVPVETESPATETTDHKHIYKHVGEVVDICATVGNVEYICECGDILWVPGGHHYGVTIIPPTETEQGYTEYDCVICGYTYRDSYTDPTG